VFNREKAKNRRKNGIKGQNRAKNSRRDIPETNMKIPGFFHMLNPGIFYPGIFQDSKFRDFLVPGFFYPGILRDIPRLLRTPY
jgi:hypothetical protein